MEPAITAKVFERLAWNLSFENLVSLEAPDKNHALIYRLSSPEFHPGTEPQASAFSVLARAADEIP